MSAEAMPLARPLEGRESTATRVLLVAAPLVAVLSRLLLVPLDDEDWDGVMTSMAEHQGRSDAGWSLAVVACGLLAATTVILARRLADAGRGRAAMFVTVTTAMGWAAAAALCLTGLYLPIAAGAADRPAQVRLQEDFNDGSVGLLFMLTTLAALGYVVLAIGLVRARAASRVAAALVAVGGAATLLTVSGPLTPVLVVAAALLGAGHGLLLAVQPR